MGVPPIPNDKYSPCQINLSGSVFIVAAAQNWLLIFLVLHILHVLNYHQRNLKCDRILEDAQIQSGRLLKLIQTVDERVPVDVELAGCLRDIQAVLEKKIY